MFRFFLENFDFEDFEKNVKFFGNLSKFQNFENLG